jgi:hypothetical protein
MKRVKVKLIKTVTTVSEVEHEIVVSDESWKHFRAKPADAQSWALHTVAPMIPVDSFRDMKVGNNFEFVELKEVQPNAQ